ncbi:hypothetical protein [Oceanithermus sp.]
MSKPIKSDAAEVRKELRRLLNAAMKAKKEGRLDRAIKQAAWFLLTVYAPLRGKRRVTLFDFTRALSEVATYYPAFGFPLDIDIQQNAAGLDNYDQVIGEVLMLETAFKSTNSELEVITGEDEVRSFIEYLYKAIELRGCCDV